MIEPCSINNRYGQSYYLNKNNSIQYDRRECTNDSQAVKAVAEAGLLQGVALILHKISQWCGNKLMQGKEFTSAENIKKVADAIVKQNNLNVTVDYINDKNISKYPSKMAEELKLVARGENAFYSDGLKLAVAPEKKPSLILHELGHAINSSKGKFLRFLQKSRHYVAAVPTALLLMNKLFKKDDNKPNFIEKNAGLIGFASFVPTILEEGLASLRGIKSAKKVLGNTVNLKPLKLNYFFAWLTYVIAGLGFGVAAKQVFADRKNNA